MHARRLHHTVDIHTGQHTSYPESPRRPSLDELRTHRLLHAYLLISSHTITHDFVTS